jgi:hypothetical protein
MGTDAKVVVRLSIEERVKLDALLNEPRVAKDRVLRMRMLLKADADGCAWSDPQIADAFDVNPATVARLRHRCVFEGLEAAIARRSPTGTKPRTLDGAAEARLVAITCTPAPEGAAQWTMQMLADKLVELKIVDEISDETVRKTLKKTNSSRGEKRSGSFRPRPTPSSSARWKKP